MPLITDVENHLITQLKAAFTTDGKCSLKTVDSLPGEFDAESVRQMQMEAPALYVLFLGGDRREEQQLALDSHWGVYAITKHAGGHRQRRQGDGREVGAYDILERALPIIETIQPEDCGNFEIARVHNMYTGNLEKMGISAYSVRLKLAMSLPPVTDASAQDNFLTYHSDMADSAENLPLDGNDHHSIEIILEPQDA